MQQPTAAAPMYGQYGGGGYGQMQDYGQAGEDFEVISDKKNLHA